MECCFSGFSLLNLYRRCSNLASMTTSSYDQVLNGSEVSKLLGVSVWWIRESTDRTGQAFRTSSFPASANSGIRYTRVGGIPAHDSIRNAGLIGESRSVSLVELLNQFLENQNAKPATITKFEQVKGNLLAFFPEATLIRSITKGKRRTFVFGWPRMAIFENQKPTRRKRS